MVQILDSSSSFVLHKSWGGGEPPPTQTTGGLGWLVEKVFCRRGFTLKCDFVAGAGVGDEVQISWCGGGWGGGAAPPPAADHSNVKQVHVECKENKETARLRRPDYFNTLLGLLLRRLFWFLFLLVVCCGFG